MAVWSIRPVTRWLSTERPLHWVLILVALGMLHIGYEWFLTTRWQARAAQWREAAAELAELQARVDEASAWRGETTVTLGAVRDDLQKVKWDLATVAAACGARAALPPRITGVRFGRREE